MDNMMDNILNILCVKIMLHHPFKNLTRAETVCNAVAL